MPEHYHDAAHVAKTAQRLLKRHRSRKTAEEAAQRLSKACTAEAEKKRFWEAVVRKLRESVAPKN